MTDRYERIRAALAMGPTPGEWDWSDAYPTQDGRKTWSLIGDGGFGILSCDGDENSPQSVNAATAELIAACDPDTIRELLCANCNFGKLMNGGVCPHQQKEAACA